MKAIQVTSAALFQEGKAAVGEGEQEALVQQIEEELVVEIYQLQYLMTVEHSYPDFHLTMHAYTCALKIGEVTLKQHVAAKWLAVEDLDQLNWAEADVLLCNSLNSDIFRK